MREQEKRLLYALNGVDPRYLQEAAGGAELACPGSDRGTPKENGGARLWLRYFSAAACLSLALLGLFRLGGSPDLPGPGGPGAVAVPPAEVSQAPAEVQPPETTPDPLQPSQPQQVTINWAQVVVNEVDGLNSDATRLYRDPALYTEEAFDTDSVRDYYGWELAPAYIPEGLTGGGSGPGGYLCRDRATGEIIEDQAGRGFWVDFYEDGSPKSDDDIVIPTGFTVTASRLGILHCALLPVDEEHTTQFDRTDVIISHASLPYGPFDPTQKDPSGLYNMPAGYYDIYVASFTLNGVEYEVMAQRLELEALIRIVSSIISPWEDIIVGVGCGMVDGEPATEPQRVYHSSK